MADIKEVKSSSGTASKPKPQSGIGYPYYNMNSGLELAEMIQNRAGGQCSMAHLASFLGYSSVKNGAFMSRLSSARLFGFVDGRGELAVTDRALAIISPIMPEDAVRARADAFLAVPLFKEVYERFKGKTLPPEVGLKNFFETHYKIVKDRITPAVRVFYESAEQAGFFDHSPDRSQLLMPLVKKGSRAAEEEQKDMEALTTSDDSPPAKKGGGGGNDISGIDPAFISLLRKLPEPGPWSSGQKKGFIDAFTATFDFIYPTKGLDDVLK